MKKTAAKPSPVTPAPTVASPSKKKRTKVTKTVQTTIVEEPFRRRGGATTPQSQQNASQATGGISVTEQPASDGASTGPSAMKKLGTWFKNHWILMLIIIVSAIVAWLGGTWVWSKWENHLSTTKTHPITKERYVPGQVPDRSVSSPVSTNADQTSSVGTALTQALRTAGVQQSGTNNVQMVIINVGNSFGANTLPRSVPIGASMIDGTRIPAVDLLPGFDTGNYIEVPPEQSQVTLHPGERALILNRPGETESNFEIKSATPGAIKPGDVISNRGMYLMNVGRFKETFQVLRK